jgi:hypothetical protein
MIDPTHVCETVFCSTYEKHKSYVSLFFDSQEDALTFFEQLSQILPFLNEEYPRIENAVVKTTEDQYYFYTLYNKQEKNELSASDVGDNYLLKTLRADKFDFSRAFILGLIPGEGGPRRQNLRPVERKAYTVTPEGTIRARMNKLAMYTQEQKEGFTQIQSSTFIDSQTQSRAFGFSQERDKKLYGLMTHLHDARINRMLVNDSGTVNHVFDYPSIISAEESPYSRREVKIYPQSDLVYFQDKGASYHPDKIREFKHLNIEARPKSHRTNEVMARLRFNPLRSLVSICSNTLEARLLAYHFAQELLKEYASYAERNNLKLNPNYRIPIIFYLPVKEKTGSSQHLGLYKHNLQFYTPEMRLKDQAQAAAIANDTGLRNRKYLECHYEFLLGLNEISPALLLELWGPRTPLGFHIIYSGHVRMFMRIVNSFSDKSTEVMIFDDFIARGLIKVNDSVIAELIKVEAFDIATRLIDKTLSDPYLLRYEEGLFVDYLITYGNPRQLNFMGLSKILLLAAEKYAWVTIKHCIKEYPHLDKGLLGQLLIRACRAKRHEEADYLLRMGADRSAGDEAAIVVAADQQDWAMVALFCAYPTDAEDQAQYGAALIQALYHEQMGSLKLLLQAGAKLSCSRFPQLQAPESSLPVLLYAVEHGIRDLDDQLIPLTSCLNQSQCLLVRDMACFSNNLEAVKLLENTISTTLISDHSIEMTLCLLVIEALVKKGRQFAEYRLLKHCHDYMLLPESDHQLTHALRIVMNSYPDCIEGISSTYVHLFFKDFFSPLWTLFKGLSTSKKSTNKSSVQFNFKEVKIAEAFVACVNHILPIQFADSPYTYYASTHMTRDQYQFLDLLAMREAESVPLSILSDFDRVEPFLEPPFFLLNPYRCIVSIDPESSLNDRLLACSTANALRSEMVIAAKKEKRMLKPDFKVPILRYVPKKSTKAVFSFKNQHREIQKKSYYVQFYTDEMRMQDQMEAKRIYQNINMRHLKYNASDYKFLLGLTTITLDILLEKHPSSGTPLALKMIADGDIRLLMRLLRNSENLILIEGVFCVLSTCGHIKKNDPVIAKLIWIGEYELAERLIDNTGSDKKVFPSLNGHLRDFLMHCANPGLWHFLGLEWLLREAAYQQSWDPIKTCVEVYPDLDKELLGELLYEACKQHRSEEAHFLLKKGALSANPTCYSPIVASAQLKDWKTVAIFVQYPTDAEDKAEYGFALLEALRDKQLALATRLLAAGAKPFCREYQSGFKSTLLYAVEHGFNEILSQLIQFEGLNERTPAFYTRCVFARDLAYANNNEYAVKLLEEFIGPVTVIDQKNKFRSICKLFLEALSMGEKRLAEYRLLHYLDEQGVRSANSLKIIIGCFDDIFPGIRDFHMDKTQISIMELLVEFLGKHEGLAFIKPLFDQSSFFFQSKNFYTALLNKLTENNFEGIFDLSQSIISNEDRKVRWHQVLDRQFHLAVKKTEADRAYLLVRLGASAEYSCTFENCCGLSAIEMASIDGNERVVQYLLEHYYFSPELRQHALFRSLQCHSPKTNIPLLHLKHGAIITAEVMVHAAMSGDETLIITLLDRIETVRLNSQEFMTVACTLWCEAYGKSRVQKKLIAMLDSSAVKHFTLLHIINITGGSIASNDYDEPFKDLRHLRAKYEISNAHAQQIRVLRMPVVDTIQTFRDLAIIFNEYLSSYENNSSPLPEENDVEKAYEDIRAQFGTIHNSVTHRLNSIKPLFFSKTRREDEFVFSMFNYLRHVDQLLTEHEPSSTDKAQLTQAHEIDSPRQVVSLH